MADHDQRPTVIIVEDDPHIAYLLGYLAQKEGFLVEHIPDGRIAAERLGSSPVADLVLLDVMLPYADGFEILAGIRTTAGWERVPVIIITSKVHEQDAVRALALGADDYLTKPFSPVELVARIRRRLQRA
jgi:DNA-binding response OmpR family regulator